MTSPEATAEQSPWRMRAVFGVARFAVAGAFRVEGLENLEALDPQEPVVVATSHHTDADIPFAGHALAKHMDLAINDMSLLHIPFYDPVSHAGIMLGGRKDFLSLDYVDQNKVQRASMFNPANFEPMIGAIEQGKRMVMAAYSPYKYRNPKVMKPGVGVPYLAAVTHARVLPVEVIMHSTRNLAISETMVRTILLHPNFSVAIGRPFRLPATDVSALRHGERSKTFPELKTALRDQGSMLIRSLASLRRTYQSA